MSRGRRTFQSFLIQPPSPVLVVDSRESGVTARIRNYLRQQSGVWLTAHEIATATGLSDSEVTSRAADLAKHGYVERELPASRIRQAQRQRYRWSARA